MEKDEIKRKSISGVIWKLLERVLAQGVTLVVSIIIARILSPNDYAVVSIVTIFFTFANILITGGLNTALIQKKNADKIDYSSVLIGSVVISAAVYAILFLCAPFIANLYSQPLLVQIVRVMGITLIITAIKSVWCAYISSHLEFRKFFFATLGGTLTSAIVGISLAIKGCGAWALVAQQMTNTIIDTIILIASVRIRISPRFSKSRFMLLFSYSWKILISSLISAVYNEIIPLLIGVKYESTNLSYYTKGRQFPGNISSTITNTLASVLFPAISKVQDNKQHVLKCTRMFIGTTSFVVFPMMLGFFAIADNFVYVILTEKWMPCVYYMRVFCIACMFSMIHIGNCETIKAIGRSDIYLTIEVIKKVLYFLVIALFLFFSNSPRILVLAFLVNEIIAICINSIPNVKLIGYKIKYQLEDLLPNLFSAISMACVVLWFGSIDINHLIKLILQVLLGVLVYSLISIVIKNRNLKNLLSVLKSLMHKN